jgi:hypothetical protein
VESRTTVVHAANGGPSAVIDPYGRITSQATLMEETLLQGCIAEAEGPSIFTQLGYLFPYLNAGVGITLLGFVVMFHRRPPAAKEPHPSVLSATLCLTSVVVLALVSNVVNAWMVGAKASQKMDMNDVWMSLQARPVIGPPPRSMNSQLELSGADALSHLFNFYGLQIGWREIVERDRGHGSIMSMSDLENVADAIGFSTRQMSLSMEGLQGERLPVLVSMGKFRYAVLFRLGDSVAAIYERNFGFGYISIEDFGVNWDGDVLRIRPPPRGTGNTPPGSGPG